MGDDDTTGDAMNACDTCRDTYNVEVGADGVGRMTYDPCPDCTEPLLMHGDDTTGDAMSEDEIREATDSVRAFAADLASVTDVTGGPPEGGGGLAERYPEAEHPPWGHPDYNLSAHIFNAITTAALGDDEHVRFSKRQEMAARVWGVLLEHGKVRS